MRNSIAGDRLRSFIERIERLEEEKAALAADIREIYSEAKGAGFDTKIIRQLIKERKMDKADRQEREELLALYRDALGDLNHTPPGEAAVDRAKTDRLRRDPAVRRMRESIARGEVSIELPNADGSRTRIDKNGTTTISPSGSKTFERTESQNA